MTMPLDTKEDVPFGHTAIRGEIPVPPIEPSKVFYTNIEFLTWITILIDQKIKFFAETKSYGEVQITLKFHEGEITNVYQSDTVNNKIVKNRLTDKMK